MNTIWSSPQCIVRMLSLFLFSVILSSCLLGAPFDTNAPAPAEAPAEGLVYEAEPALPAPAEAPAAQATEEDLVDEAEPAPPAPAEAPAAQATEEDLVDEAEPAPPTPAPVQELAATGSAQATVQADSLALVDRFLASMNSANIAFNSPQTLNLDETAQIQLLLSLRKSAEELRHEITQPGSAESARVKVANRMAARLTGPNFHIIAITAEEQAVGASDTVEWQWEIKPRLTGHHNLHLTLTAVFDIEGAPTRRSVRTFDKTIEVEVTPGQVVVGFVDDNWQWLWAVVLVPIVGWFWRRRTSKDTGAG